MNKKGWVRAIVNSDSVDKDVDKYEEWLEGSSKSIVEGEEGKLGVLIEGAVIEDGMTKRNRERERTIAMLYVQSKYEVISVYDRWSERMNFPYNDLVLWITKLPERFEGMDLPPEILTEMIINSKDKVEESD